MIVSHRLETVFLHNRKAGGTSVSLALATACGPNDVITATMDDDVGIEVGARPAQNDRVPWSALTPRKVAKIVTGRGWPIYEGHTTASDAIRLVGAKRWRRYFTFTVERNPWDKAVSRYFWDRNRPDKGQGEAMPPFSEWVRQVPSWKLSGWHLYTVDGKVMVDRVLRYERLNDELSEVWQRLGVQPPVLPRAKGALRPSWARDWRVMYSDEAAEFIADVCRREIDLFGYAFDDSRQPRLP